jgi:hypothetical protein
MTLRRYSSEYIAAVQKNSYGVAILTSCETHAWPSAPTSPRLGKLMSPEDLHCHSRYRERTEFQKHIQKGNFQAVLDIFFSRTTLSQENRPESSDTDRRFCPWQKPVSAMAKSLE